jgi:hypothetical protein
MEHMYKDRAKLGGEELSRTSGGCDPAHAGQMDHADSVFAAELIAVEEALGLAAVLVQVILKSRWKLS